ncbi:MAG: hypothetical protein M1828_003354 [Chrysothrix sp. TS-e1954]|nr:MAG: hypothetical protein M1828_003354 [Chrysothrix sp. TS-e1954]
MAPKIAIVFYSMYGHVQKLAEAEKAGIEKAGGSVDLIQVPETLPQEVLQKMHAPAKPSDIKTLKDPSELESYDGFLFGVPTRYGNMPAQWKAFWDSTGKQWQTGGYFGKSAGMFVSTSGPGGGQESTVMSCMSTLVHHGINFVPLGYAHSFGQLTNLSEVHGGSPWGAGTFAVRIDTSSLAFIANFAQSGDGSRMPTPLELEIATIQGETFCNHVARATK